MPKVWKQGLTIPNTDNIKKGAMTRESVQDRGIGDLCYHMNRVKGGSDLGSETGQLTYPDQMIDECSQSSWAKGRSDSGSGK